MAGAKLLPVSSIVDWIIEVLDLPPEVVVVVLSALPVVELRGAIPIAIGVYDMAPPKAFALGVVGNALPIAVMLRHHDALATSLRKRSNRLGRLSDWLFDRAYCDVAPRYERYGAAILAVLVLLGAWKVCLVALLLDVRPRLAAIAITAGLLFSGALITLATVGVLAIPT